MELRIITADVRSCLEMVEEVELALARGGFPVTDMISWPLALPFAGRVTTSEKQK